MDELQTPKLDHAAFRRVWKRVMPEDRPDCPFTLDPPLGQEGAPLPSHSCPPTPAVPPVVRPPAAPAGPCLGEGSAGELPRLERLCRQVWMDYQSYRTLSRRAGRERIFPSMAEAKRGDLRRLTTAAFLISGRQFRPEGGQELQPGNISLAVRDRFRSEQLLSLEFFSAAQSCSDACLIDLYRALGRQCQGYAGRLRGWLEERS